MLALPNFGSENGVTNPTEPKHVGYSFGRIPSTPLDIIKYSNAFFASLYADKSSLAPEATPNSHWSPHTTANESSYKPIMWKYIADKQRKSPPMLKEDASCIEFVQ